MCFDRPHEIRVQPSQRGCPDQRLPRSFYVQRYGRTPDPVAAGTCGSHRSRFRRGNVVKWSPSEEKSTKTPAPAGVFVWSTRRFSAPGTSPVPEKLEWFRPDLDRKSVV